MSGGRWPGVGVPWFGQPSWSSTDIGAVGAAGSASFSGGVYTLNGAGIDIGGYNDACHYMYSSLSGNGTIVARIASLSGDEYTKVGVMVRESFASGSKNAFAGAVAGHGMAAQGRPIANDSTDFFSGSSVSLPYWVRLTRSGNSFTAFDSPDGATWTQINSTITVSMATAVYIGIVVNSHSATLATATFDNVSVT